MNGSAIEDYDFELPPERIAQSGVEPRDASRLLVARGGGLAVEHRAFHNLPEYLRPGDVLVVNRTRVIPARLNARRPGGGRLEVLLLRERSPLVWSAFLRPARKAKVGAALEFGPLSATVEGVLEDGARLLRFSEDVRPHLGEIGALPLPPYIRNEAVGERYQTVYAAEPGSVAAPTAGLHFTPGLLERLSRMGVEVRPLTLHVGAGTFKPVGESVETHAMHAEPYEVPPETAEAVTRAKRENRRVVAVGTTVVRALESAWREDRLEAGEGETALFIRPPYRFSVPDALITNFHLPRSTLLMLVAAFAGYPTMRAAYAAALEEGYRFYSLGDAMLVL